MRLKKSNKFTKELYHYLEGVGCKDKYLQVANVQIAFILGVTEHTVQQHINWLDENRYISRITGKSSFKMNKRSLKIIKEWEDND